MSDKKSLYELRRASLAHFWYDTSKNMAHLSRDDVLKLARLAHIRLSDEEADMYAHEFDEILQYVEQLQTVDVDGLAPTSQVTGLTNVTRSDNVVSYGYETADLLRTVPQVQADHIKVKKVL